MAEGEVPFLGSSISLISKAEIRYEGTLFSISMEESSITLQNVKSYGSEGRRRDGPQVPPSNEVYEFIIFKGEDIKDLTVLQGTPAPPVAHDPAIISATGPQQQGGLYSQQAPPPSAYSSGPWGPHAAPNQGQGYTALYGSSQWGPPHTGGPPPPAQEPPRQQAPPPSGMPMGAPAPTVSVAPAQRGPSGPPPQQQQQAPPPAPAPKPTNYAQAAGARPQGGRGGPAGGRGGAPAGGGGRGAGPSAGQGGGRGPPGQPRPAAAPALPVPQEDFDFDSALKKFNKEDVKKEAANKEGALYVKDDFFDLLSCEALDRAGGERGRIDWHQKVAEQRKVDMETFGGLGGVRHHHYRGRGRGGHHGGRGGGMSQANGGDGGRGRGGYGGGRGGGYGRGGGGRGGRGN